MKKPHKKHQSTDPLGPWIDRLPPRKAKRLKLDTRCTICMHLSNTRKFQPAFVMLNRAIEYHKFSPSILARAARIDKEKFRLILEGEIPFEEADQIRLEYVSGMHIRTQLFVSEKQQAVDWWTLHRHEFANRKPPPPPKQPSVRLYRTPPSERLQGRLRARSSYVRKTNRPRRPKALTPEMLLLEPPKRGRKKVTRDVVADLGRLRLLPSAAGPRCSEPDDEHGVPQS